MKGKKWLNFLVPGMALLVLIFGCAAQMEKYGEVLPQPKGDQVTIEMLEKNWEDYIAYWDGSNGEGTAIAVMFDPKDDDLTLATHSWIRINDEATLKNVIGWIRDGRAAASIPRVWRIMGPNNQLFGYIYTYDEPVPLHVINDKKIFVDSILMGG